jgi:hypothetical protein
LSLLCQLRSELNPSSTLEMLIVERIGAVLWRTRRVLDFEAGVALERDHAREKALDRLLYDMEMDEPRDPAALEQAQALTKSLPPAGSLDLDMRYEAHLGRELSRLLAQLEKARRLAALNVPAVA